MVGGPTTEHVLGLVAGGAVEPGVPLAQGVDVAGTVLGTKD